MSPSVSVQAVRQLLSQDILTAEALSELLNRESTILKERNHSQLHQLLAEKQPLMAKLENSALQRSRWLQQNGETSQTQDELWNQFLTKLDDRDLSDLWNHFQEKINNCQRHNDINGKMIARGQRTLRQLLNILRGQQVGAPKLYNQAGNTQIQNGSHTLIKA